MFKGTQAVAAFALCFGMVGGVSFANAADFGGDCCADLEERVAELEATAARKDNRRVSLTVYGQVHEAVSFWDDGSESNVYVGSSNNSRSRFGFKGGADINADWSAGFLMEIGVRSNDLSDVSQDNPVDDANIDIRHEALFIKSKTLGTIWLGWSSSATQGITEVDLGGALNAEPDVDDWFGGFNLNFEGGSSSVRYESLGRWGMSPGDGDRRDIVRYVSPTFAGFSVSAAAGGDDFWDVALRYANQFGDLRVAGGIGYQQVTNGIDDASADCESAGTGDKDLDCRALGLSASFMHMPTGLYVSGAYGYSEDSKVEEVIGAGAKDEDEFFYVNAGINQRFNSFGNTIVYGEYYNFEGGARSVSLSSAPNLTGNLAESEVEIFGFGIVQNIDSAAMEIYAGYRYVEAEVTDDTGASAKAEDLNMVQVGARIKF